MILIFPYKTYIFFRDNSIAWFKPLIIIDVIVFCYLIAQMVRLSLFSFSITMHASVSYGGHFKVQNRLLQNSLNNSRLRVTNSTAMLAKTLSLFIQDHTHVSMIIVYVDHDVWAKVLAVAILCQCPSNVYIFNRIIVEGINVDIGISFIITWTIMINQIVMLLTSFLLMARYSKIITYRSARLLPSVQYYISARYPTLKIKCLDIYERITQKQIGVSLGPNDTCTYRMVYQVFYNLINLFRILFKFI